MEEKLDLFELTIKRGLEHYELPIEDGAWNKFQSSLDAGAAPSAGGTTSSFLTKFGLAAAALAGIGIFINYHSNQGAGLVQGHEVIAEQSAIESGTGAQSATTKPAAEETYVVAEEATQSAEISEKETPVKTELSSTQEKQIKRINSKLQEAARTAPSDSGADIDTKTVTRYVGNSFNLGASKEFSPNDDGSNDTFLPSSLKSTDIFIMSISTLKGEKVFSTDDVNKPWNGKDDRGNSVREGTYSWEVEQQVGTNREIFRGEVLLKR